MADVTAKRSGGGVAVIAGTGYTGENGDVLSTPRATTAPLAGRSGSGATVRPDSAAG